MAAIPISYKVKMREALQSFKTARTSAAARFDTWLNNSTGFGTHRDKTTHGFIMPSRLLSDIELSALYHSDDMAARMIDVVPQEMLREGFHIETGDSDVDAGISQKFGGLGGLDARTKLADGIRWGRAFGGGAVIMGADDGRDADTPLVPESADDIDFLYAIDRRALWPTTYYDQAGHPLLGKPETYLVSTYGGLTYSTSIVHESRLLLFGGAPTANEERMSLAGWDMSVLQRAFDVLRQFNTGWKAVETLMTDGNQAIYKMTGFADMLAAGGGELLQERVRALELFRSVMRALVIDADGLESFERTSTSFSDIPQTLDKFMLRLAAAVQIPVTILMGQSPAGMNATGESDFRWFYDRIRAMQTTDLEPRIRRLVDVWLRTKAGQEAVKGKKLSALNVKFPVLWTETPLVAAQRRYAIAQGDAIYLQAQAVMPDEVGLHRFQPEGFSREIVLSKEGISARQAALTSDLDKLEAAADEASGDAVLEQGAVDETTELNLTPSDLAAIVKVNEARASVGLTPLPGKDGDLTLPQFKAKYATTIAAAANAEDGVTDDGSGQPHTSTVGVQEPPKKPAPPALPPQGGAFGQPHALPPGAPQNEQGGPNAPGGGASNPSGRPDATGDAEKPVAIVRTDAKGPRPFELHRDIDDSKVSGTGIVASGAEFDDGTVVLRWRGKNAATTMFGNMKKMLSVHGHGGKTRVVYTDDLGGERS